MYTTSKTVPGFLSRSCWKWNVAESYSFFLNIKSAIIWKSQTKRIYIRNTNSILMYVPVPLCFLIKVWNDIVLRIILPITTQVLTTVASSFSASIFKSWTHCCWQASRSSTVKNILASFNMAWNNKQTKNELINQQNHWVKQRTNANWMHE